MKKLYAIRDKETGKIVNDNYGHPHVRRCPEDVFDSRRDELVTLRIEPTEPCEVCETFRGEMITPSYAFELTLDADDWHFCPNCGRRLGDE